MLLEVVGQVAQLGLPGQARAALEGVQDPQQVVQRLGVAVAAVPAAERQFEVLQQVVGFLEEDVEDLALVGRRALRRQRLEADAGGYAQLLVGIAAQAPDLRDQRLPVGQRAMATHRLEHLGQLVVAALQQAEQGRAGAQASAAEAFVEEFKLMGEVADLADLGHPRTALEGMQVALQGFQFDGVVDVVDPALQRGGSAVEDIEAFLEEDLHQFRIALFERLRSGRLRRGRHGGLLDGRCNEFLDGAFRLARCRGLGQRALAEPADRLDKVVRVGQGLAGAQLVELFGQPVVTGLQQSGQLRGVLVTAVDQSFIEGLQLVGQVADLGDLGHPCAALEGVQVALQGAERRQRARLGLPLGQCLAGAFEDVHRLFEEDRHHFLVQLAAGSRCRRCRYGLLGRRPGLFEDRLGEGQLFVFRGEIVGA